VSDEPFLKLFIAVPNPTDGNFSAIVQLREIADYSLLLFNDKSILIEAKNMTGSIVEEIEFIRNDLPPGVYFLQFVSEKTMATLKVIIR
jgi:hypothetical protein